MKLDLRQDKEKIRQYIAERIERYPVYVNDGPGDDSDPIQAVMLGFYAEQGGYIYLVFDTRPGLNLDGNWTLHIDEPNMLHFPKWCEFYEAACEGEPVTIVLDSGEEKVLACSVNGEDELVDDNSLDELNSYFAEALLALMYELRDDETLAKLPLREDAFFMVEEFDGRFFWPDLESIPQKGLIVQHE